MFSVVLETRKNYIINLNVLFKGDVCYIQSLGNLIFFFFLMFIYEHI